MDSNRLGDDRLMRAIQTGKPVPGTPEQAAELAGTRRANIVQCAECGEVGDRGYFGKNIANPIPLPICAACKAEADAVEEGKIGVLRQALDAAFAPVVALAKKTTETREMKARSWARTELLMFIGSETACNVPSETWTPWFEEILDAYLRGVKPDWAIGAEDVCERCGSIDMEREECELSRDPDDTGVGYRSVCRACGEGSEDEPQSGRAA